METRFDLMPYVTEKSSAEMSENTFTFILVGDANKIELKSYLVQQYGVDVKKINVSKKLSKTI